MASILRGVRHEGGPIPSLFRINHGSLVISAAIWSFHDCTESDRFRSHETNPRVGAADSKRRVIADAPSFA